MGRIRGRRGGCVHPVELELAADTVGETEARRRQDEAGGGRWITYREVLISLVAQGLGLRTCCAAPIVGYARERAEAVVHARVAGRRGLGC